MRASFGTEIKVFYSHMIKFFIRLSSSSDISSTEIFNQQYFLNSLRSELKEEASKQIKSHKSSMNGALR